MPRVVHFEIPADNPDRAVVFYTSVFGWIVNKWEGPKEYWLLTTGTDENPGINGAIIRRANPAPQGQANAYICTIDVDNLDSYIERVTQAGGAIVSQKQEIPEVGWISYAKDTEGNTFCMMESTPVAE